MELQLFDKKCPCEYSFCEHEKCVSIDEYNYIISEINCMINIINNDKRLLNLYLVAKKFDKINREKEKTKRDVVIKKRMKEEYPYLIKMNHNELFDFMINNGLNALPLKKFESIKNFIFRDGDQIYKFKTE